MDRWLGNRKKILVLNREDMVSKADRNAWASYFTKQGVDVLFANGKLGMVMTLALNYTLLFYFVSISQNLFIFDTKFLLDAISGYNEVE
jgi:hypothetical protein